MSQISRVGVLFALIGVVGGATACQQAPGEEVGTAASAGTYSPKIGGICPSEDRVWFQHLATETFRSIAQGGSTGSTPADNYPCADTAGTATDRAPGATTDAVVDYVQTVQSFFAADRCRFTTSTVKDVCGLKAIEYDLECDSPPDAEYIAVNAFRLDRCWGDGVSAFFWSNTSKSLAGTKYTVHIDPEPVRLTQELSGSTGAMAAGYYVNSGASSKVVKWPGTWTPGSLSAGTPCSTVDLAASQDAKQTIQAYGSYRKCL